MSILNHAIVRVLTDTQEPRQAVGAGFLVSQRHFLTCAHVVNDALHLPQDTADKPEGIIYLDFPLLPRHNPLPAKVYKWFAVKETNTIGELDDICVLELAENISLPNQAQPISLVSIAAGNFFDRTVRMFGFPDGHDDGDWLNGNLQDTISNGWVQLETEIGRRSVAPGFSGTAVWDKKENAVVGMMVSIHIGEMDTAAYIIPVNTLINAWEELGNYSRPPNPYRGLSAFREEDADYYFGREQTVQDLVDMVDEQPFIAVIGASGSGKSSIIFAGLIPQLRKDWFIVDFKPRNQPFNELALALIPLLYSDELEQAKKLTSFIKDLATGDIGLSQIVQLIIRKHSSKRLLLIVDQFEELYTLNTQEVQQDFITCLLEVVNYSANDLGKAPPFVLLFTMRADFMGQATENKDFAQALDGYDNKILGPMAVDSLRATIEKPAAKYQVKLESGLTDRILHDLGDSPGNLPLLEFALTQLWEQMDKGILTHDAYKAIGEVNKALANHANEFYDQLDADNQVRLRRIFIQLVRPGEGTEDTRQVATREDIGEDNWDLVVQMADARLVVTGRNLETEEETVEVVHEALIRSWLPLQEWMRQDRQFRIWQNRLKKDIQEWEKGTENEEYLLLGKRLLEAEDNLKERVDELSSKEKKYIESSIALREQKIAKQEKARQEKEELRQRELQQAQALAVEQRKRVDERIKAARKFKIIAISSIMITILAIFLAVFTFIQMNTSNKHFHTAKARLYHAKAQVLSETNAPLALRLAERARELDPLDETIDRMLQDIYAHGDLDLSSLRYKSTVVPYRERNNLLLATGEIGKEPIIITSDGQQIVKNIASKWDVQKPLLISLSGHQSGVNSAEFSPDGTSIVTASYDNTSKVWDVQGNLLATLSGHLENVSSAMFSPNGALIVTASLDNTAKVWNVQGDLLATLSGHSKWLSSAEFSPDGALIVTASLDKTAKVWNVQGMLLATLSGHKDHVNSAIFSPDGALIVTVSNDRTTKLWNVQGKLLTSFVTSLDKRIFDQTNSVAFSPDGASIVTTSHDMAAKVWSVQGKLLATLRHKGSVNSAKFSPDGTLIITASADKTAKVWDVQGKLLATLSGHLNSVNSAAFSPDGTSIVTTSIDNTVKVWNQWEIQRQLSITYSTVNSAVLSPDQQRIVTTSFNKIEEEPYVPGSFVVLGHQDEVNTAKTAKVWNVQGELLFTLVHQDEVNTAAFSPDNTKIITTSDDKTAKVWDMQGNTLAILEHQDEVKSAVFSLDGSQIKTITKNNNINVWRGDLFVDDFLKSDHLPKLTVIEQFFAEVLTLEEISGTKVFYENLEKIAEFYKNKADQSYLTDVKIKYLKQAAMLYQNIDLKKGWSIKQELAELVRSDSAIDKKFEPTHLESQPSIITNLANIPLFITIGLLMLIVSGQQTLFFQNRQYLQLIIYGFIILVWLIAWLSFRDSSYQFLLEVGKYSWSFIDEVATATLVVGFCFFHVRKRSQHQVLRTSLQIFCLVIFILFSGYLVYLLQNKIPTMEENVLIIFLIRIILGVIPFIILPIPLTYYALQPSNKGWKWLLKILLAYTSILFMTFSLIVFVDSAIVFYNPIPINLRFLLLLAAGIVLGQVLWFQFKAYLHPHKKWLPLLGLMFIYNSTVYLSLMAFWDNGVFTLSIHDGVRVIFYYEIADALTLLLALTASGFAIVWAINWYRTQNYIKSVIYVLLGLFLVSSSLFYFRAYMSILPFFAVVIGGMLLFIHSASTGFDKKLQQVIVSNK